MIRRDIFNVSPDMESSDNEGDDHRVVASQVAPEVDVESPSSKTRSIPAFDLPANVRPAVLLGLSVPPKTTNTFSRQSFAVKSSSNGQIVPETTDATATEAADGTSRRRQRSEILVSSQGQASQFRLLKENKFMKDERAQCKKIGLIFAILGIAITVVVGGIEATKDTRVKDDNVMRSTTTGEAVLCANTDLLVQDGILMSRPQTAESNNGRRLASASQVSSAIATTRALTPRQLSSTMPASYFKELEWLELQSPTSASLSMKITGIIRVPSIKAACGSYLKIVTSGFET
jgi:hypothetical protein